VLHVAAANGHLATVRLVIDYVDVNAQDKVRTISASSLGVLTCLPCVSVVLMCSSLLCVILPACSVWQHGSSPVLQAWLRQSDSRADGRGEDAGDERTSRAPIVQPHQRGAEEQERTEAVRDQAEMVDADQKKNQSYLHWSGNTQNEDAWGSGDLFACASRLLA